LAIFLRIFNCVPNKESGKECVKTISTGIPIRGNNKRKAEERKDEILLRWKDEQAQRKALQPNDYYNGDSEYVCTAFNGELFKPDYVSKHFKLIMKDNGLQKIRFHDLRHSAGTYLKYLGFDLRDIQAWLRHADIKTASQYAHMDLSAKAPIAAKLNEKLSKMGL
jgi:integrase